MRVRSIRARLTLWYAGVLLLILGLFAAGVYFTMRRTLSDALNDALQNRAILTRELLVFDGGGQPGLPLNEDTQDPNRGESFQRLVGTDGQILFDNSASFGDVPLEQIAVSRALSGRRHISTVDAGDEQARVLSLPVEREGRIVGALQIGESTEDLDRTLRSLLIVFAISLPAALVLAAIGGYWLATRALSPIDNITRAADDISERDLSRRLDLDLPDDEVGRLARTFDRMIARLDAAFQRQRQFAADASHELRTPLAAIRGQLDVLSKRPKEIATYEKVVETIGEQAERMTRLVGGLLMLARGDADALPVEKEPVLIPELVRSVADQMRPAAREKGLRLDVEGDGEPEVTGDDDLLVQLLLNLVDNAIKYTDRGGVVMRWRTGDRMVHVDVRDTGPGIPPEYQARVFERFFRVDVARSRAAGGAGLGLAICRWIAEEHGGSISVTSTEAGSTFTVSLPLV